jgi:tetraacyldisaccharide-1-P 4'-kinase
VTGNHEEMLGLEWLIGKTVIGSCAIGRPEAFVRSLRLTVGRGGEVETLVLPDHAPFRQAAVKKLIAAAKAIQADAIVVTDKDWSKLRHVDSRVWPCPVVRAKLAMVFDSGLEELDELTMRAVSGVKT